MADFELLRELAVQTPSKIVMIVMDGLGGLPMTPGGKTELESAHTPNLNELACKSICGLSVPISPGVTPGSGPSHLALFGYDPIKYDIGRGVLEALGIDFDLKSTDVAARGNFCSVNEQGIVTDRRAGRISTEKNADLCKILGQIRIDGVEIFVEPVKDYRFVLVLRALDLGAEVTETDPQREGLLPRPVEALNAQSRRTAEIVNRFVEEAKVVLCNEHPANLLLLRGFSKYPDIPTMSEVYRLKPAAVASYPMYRGLAKLVGMNVLPTGPSLDDEVATLKKHYDDFDFFFFHVKWTDSAGEDGDFDRKVAVIEDVDKRIPAILSLNPDVVIVSGDHSTPAVLKSHSWHPLPTLIYSSYCRPDGLHEYSETACRAGSLGIFPAVDIMPLALANALKLSKYGA
ncbi:MAG: 2,3-bisphosphoglycerate-independent phosphoglycerate mutase [Dehalococcoidia bacterium]|nr:2,3-bisphosphoglycerate-independent phosphoglycerate mutase [Dehalococcoidia bacterium]